MKYDLNELTEEQILVASEKCKQSLLFFTRFFFKLLRGNKFILNWHHETIINELENTAKYKYKLLNVNIPPRYSKTELVGINFIAWSLARNPRANFLYITASDELRSETSIRIRDIITHPVYVRMFGVDIKKDQSGKNLWRTTAGGGLKTATIFGQITGFGAGRMTEDNTNYFEGGIVLDDINKILDSEANNANNKKSVDTIFTTILSRKNTDDTPIVNMQQRTGINDSSSALLDHFSKEQTKSLVMPIITKGVPLWKFKHDIADIEILKNSPRTSRIFETQYMQNPQPSANLTFAKDKLSFYENINKENAIGVISYTDTADEGVDYLFTAFGYVFINEQIEIYIDDIIYNTNPLKYNLPIVVDRINKHNCNYSVIESNSLSSFELEKMKKMLNGSQLLPVNNFKNKEARIEVESTYITSVFKFKNDFSDSEYGQAMTHFTNYLRWTNNQKDDCPDGLTGLSRFAKTKFKKYYDKL